MLGGGGAWCVHEGVHCWVAQCILHVLVISSWMKTIRLELSKKLSFARFIMTTCDLPDCPKFMECPISQERMEDPVVAGDHHSYDRKFIQQWFDKGNRTSPLTRAVISQHLAPNQNLKTLIQEWVDDQLRGKADMQKLDLLKARIFSVTTSEEALSLVTQIRKLVVTFTR